MILLIDNYDSFAYNLYQFIGMLNPDIKVIRNDELTATAIKALNPSHIVLSPGPGYPQDAGVCMETAAALGKEIPQLGVCLGHQAICAAFGATVAPARKLMHGKTSEIALDNSCPLFQGLPPRIKAARYHSLAALNDTIPPCLRVTAETDDGEVMGVMHNDYPVFGVQFHPESIMTPDGMQIIRNFVTM
ncbi:MAG TPA: aminodeoxychorismate/anthranilate synthase component II [Syntrophomonas sp.]|nr:aminodeoxychorismate/anthranilate synthase component II [Syntrophomonas sp.]